MTDAWSSSPSPSLDALSSESSSSSSVFLVGWHVLLTLPRRIWDVYVAYLWYYKSSSWVGRVASTFRLLAVALILPVVLLTLLDVTSYVIARTLGVVDDVKASTSDVDTISDDRRADVAIAVPVSSRLSTTFASEGPGRGSEDLASEDSVEGWTSGDGVGRGRGEGRVSGTALSATMSATGVHGRAQAWETCDGDEIEVPTHTGTGRWGRVEDASLQTCYFAGVENLRLAGEGVFSPAVSVPPSPLTPGMPFHGSSESDGRGTERLSEDEGVVLRRRAQGTREDGLVHT